jgi:hypothetical protein
MLDTNAALTFRPKEIDEITSSEIKNPYAYLYKVTGWLSPKVKRWISGNADTAPVIDTAREQVIDVTSTVGIPLDLSDFLEQLYTFRDGATVRAFLARYPFLISLLLEASLKISSFFPEREASLQIITDPEAAADEQLMVIIIETSSPEEVYDRLERLDSEWWIGAVDRAKGRLCINVEFV